MPEDQLKHQAPSNLISLFQFELKKLLILIFGIFFSISAEAFFFQSISLSEKETTPFIIDSLIDEYSLINHCSFLLDPNDDYSIQHLLDSSHDSIFSSASFFSKKRVDVNTNPWIKVVLQSQLKEFNTFRFYPYGKTTSDIEIYPDVLEVYLVDSIGQILNKKTGAHLPYSSIDKGEPALEKYRKEYNAITFQLAPNEIRTIYVKATSVSFKLSVRPTLSPILSATAEHEKLLLERRLPDAFYQGIIWMLFGYHFLIFLVRREGTYLLFSIYLLAAALYYLSLSTLSFYAFPEWLPFIKYFPV